MDSVFYKEVHPLQHFSLWGEGPLLDKLQQLFLMNVAIRIAVCLF